MHGFSSTFIPCLFFAPLFTISSHVLRYMYHRTFPRHVFNGLFHGRFSTARFQRSFPRHVFHGTFSTARFPRHVFHGTFSTARFSRHVLNARFHLLYRIHPVYLYSRLRHFMYNVHIAVLPLDISSLAAVLQ